jgi:hypothetical protein
MQKTTSLSNDLAQRQDPKLLVYLGTHDAKRGTVAMVMLWKLAHCKVTHGRQVQTATNETSLCGSDNIVWVQHHHLWDFS